MALKRYEYLPCQNCTKPAMFLHYTRPSGPGEVRKLYYCHSCKYYTRIVFTESKREAFTLERRV